MFVQLNYSQHLTRLEYARIHTAVKYVFWTAHYYKFNMFCNFICSSLDAGIFGSSGYYAATNNPAQSFLKKIIC